MRKMYSDGILIISLQGLHILISAKLDFGVTNNVFEYEAGILGVQPARALEIIEWV